MSTQAHRDLTGDEIHVPGIFDSVDPGNIGTGRYWYDSARGVLKIRNTSNGGWETVGGAYFGATVGGGETFPGPVGPGRLWIDTTNGANGYVLKVRNAANTGWENLLYGQTPVGGFGFWHKTLMASLGYSLPFGWVECNGQTLSDTQSILNGQVIPNLNVGNGTGRFLRGTTGTTGVAQANQNKTHNHVISISDPGHAHAPGSLVADAVGDHAHLFHFDTDTHGSGGTNNWKDGGGTAKSTDGAGAHGHSISGSTAAAGTGISASSGAGSADGSEARPDSFTVCIIMRVK